MRNTKKTLIILSVIVILVFSINSKIQKTARVGVSFSWKGIKKGSNRSPVIKVTKIPAGTKYFLVTLKDLDVPKWNHGGGKVRNDNSGVIPAGALKNGYNGPNPPSGSHRYQFTVKALDSKGKIIGIGTATKSFP